MSSPIILDGSPFKLGEHPVNRFIAMGPQRGTKGITHTLFLKVAPIHPMFFVGDQANLSGYCSYRFIYNNNSSLLIGVVFLSLSSRTVVSDYTLSVGNAAMELPDSFDPSFLLEKSVGIILFKANDSSILAIPSEVSSNLLIRTD